MSNLFDPRKPSAPEGFTPYVDNDVKKPSVNIVLKILFWFFGTVFFLFAPIYFLVKKNELIRRQNELNQAASTIDVQLAKRADTLIKLTNLIHSYKDHEQKLFSDVARLRSLVGSNRTIKENNELNDLSNNVFSKMSAVFESYPELKSNELYKQGMDQVIYLEREVAASRRLYNSKATGYNADILTLPISFISEPLGLSTYPLFQASATQRADVDMSNI